LQYLAGLGLNLYQSASIYQRMIADTQYPEHLFEGSSTTLDALRSQIQRSLNASRPSY
jgi:hypothetical protein